MSLFFVMTSWAFMQNGADMNDNADFLGIFNFSGISFFGFVWIYKVILLTSPAVVLCVLFAIFELFIDPIRDFFSFDRTNCCHFAFSILCFPMVIMMLVIFMGLLFGVTLIVSLVAAEFVVLRFSPCCVPTYE